MDSESSAFMLLLDPKIIKYANEFDDTFTGGFLDTELAPLVWILDIYPDDPNYYNRDGDEESDGDESNLVLIAANSYPVDRNAISLPQVGDSVTSFSILLFQEFTINFGNFQMHKFKKSFAQKIN